MSEIKEGSVVKLKHADSLGVKMTVERIFKSMDGDLVASCVWFSSYELKRETIALAALKLS